MSFIEIELVFGGANYNGRDDNDDDDDVESTVASNRDASIIRRHVNPGRGGAAADALNLTLFADGG